MFAIFNNAKFSGCGSSYATPRPNEVELVSHIKSISGGLYTVNELLKVLSCTPPRQGKSKFEIDSAMQPMSLETTLYFLIQRYETGEPYYQDQSPLPALNSI